MTRALQQKIHMGCRALGMDSDTRQAMQKTVTGKSSMTDMNETDLRLVLNHLKDAGFKPASKGHFKHAKAPRADLRMIHVLWGKLGEKGVLREPTRKGLNAFIRARFEKTWGSVPADVDMLRQWEHIDQVVQALKMWGERSDIDFDWEQHAR